MSLDNKVAQLRPNQNISRQLDTIPLMMHTHGMVGNGGGNMLGRLELQS